SGSWVAPLKAMGADIVMVDNSTLPKQVRAEIGNDSVPLALDAIGGKASMRLADCLSDNGVVVNYGFLSGDPCMITSSQTIVHGIELKGFWLVKNLFQKPRQQIEHVFSEITRLIFNGTLNTPIEAIYRLDQVKEALAHAQQEKRQGKIVLVPNPDKIPANG
ncbi:MAG: zinc-binding dehydrogenase, partial [Gammaproteobacteria bacterium]|nr:zinc-binding dehydrogenase [Gammaproteobacteria bacterium]